jgi:hypothetical protein
MRKLLSILSFVLLYVTIAFGQAAVDFPVLVEDNAAANQTIWFGLDLAATNGIDPGLGESDLPPPPPGNAFDARWWLPPFAGALSSWRDYRAPGATPAFPFTGQVEYQIKFQTTDFPITVSWNLPPEIAATSLIRDLFGGVIVSGSFSGTGSLVVSNPAVGGLQVLVDYNGIGPSGPEPEFAIAPASLDFGGIAVGLFSTLQATVSNPGTDPLTISNIVSSDPQFTFAPGVFPIVVAPAGSQVFDVTFSPTALGTFPATLSFTHDGVNVASPFDYSVQGVGADAGPTFGVTPASLNFGTVTFPASATLQLEVFNYGLSNPMNITSAVATLPEYTVVPATATIPPGGSLTFDVTFTPPVAGTFAGDVVFTHNGTTSPDAVPVTGIGFVPAAVRGLVFEHDSVFVLEADFYSETMQLKDVPPGPKVQAIQFRLVTNNAVDDTTILTFTNIQKGADVADASWALEYNVRRGTINSNGASLDTILVLLYNLLEDNGLPGGADYDNLLTVNYKVADLPALQDYAKSSFLIRFAEASTHEGNPIDITPQPVNATEKRDELVVVAKNRVGSWGDVNGDGCLDILDLIMVVDHIVGRDSLDADEFARADIAPWAYALGSEPTPDGFVNVQDLTIIQNTILTGYFPNEDPVGLCGGSFTKFNGQADATVNIYINSEGISAFVDSKIGIRGAQIEFENVVDNADNMVINTPLGRGYHLRVDDLLRTLMYDRLGQKYIEDGVNSFMADMPFVISNPEDITLEKLILVDINQHKVMNVEVNLIYSTITLPYDYVLYQNFPNPFNPSTSVRFQVPNTSDVTIKVYDMLGQEVRTLFAGEVLRGTYTVNWDGLNNAGQKMSSGSYVYRMTAGEFVQSKKMVLLK